MEKRPTQLEEIIKELDPDYQRCVWCGRLKYITDLEAYYITSILKNGSSIQIKRKECVNQEECISYQRRHGIGNPGKRINPRT